MKRRLQLAFILLAVPAVFLQDHRYCTLPSCPNRTHILCQYPQSGPRECCGTPVRLGINSGEKLLLLYYYNDKVPSITLTEMDEYFERPIADLSSETIHYRLQWDEELAQIAQRWAEQCILQIDSCRNTDRFNVMQRVGRVRTYLHEGEPTMYRLISLWYQKDRIIRWNEISFQGLSWRGLSNFASDIYTQMMRQRADNFGCGSVRSYDDRYQNLYLVCNFAQA